jgi:hypothetical protein
VAWYYWEDDFLFHRITEIGLGSGKIDLSSTTHHRNFINPEVWWDVHSFSDRPGGFRLFLVARYQYIRFALDDRLNASWLHWSKSLQADLHHISGGFRIQRSVRRVFGIYGGMDAGYCFGYLTTYQDFEKPDDYRYAAKIEGDGGGGFCDFVIGITSHPFFSFGYPNVGLFLEAGYFLSPEWESFHPDSITDDMVYGDLGEDRSNIRIHLANTDRQLAKRVFSISLGLSLEL